MANEFRCSYCLGDGTRCGCLNLPRIAEARGEWHKTNAEQLLLASEERARRALRELKDFIAKNSYKD